jgi:hypothetical protein
MARPTSLPWIDFRQDDASLVPVGGIVVPFKAAQTLVIGDAVWLSAADTAQKSNSAADGVKFLGFVVGGFRTFGEILDSRYNQTNLINIQAALVNEEVLVQIDGIAWGISDGAIIIGAEVQLGVTTAGRIDDPAAVAGQVLGKALTAAAGANVATKILIARR